MNKYLYYLLNTVNFNLISEDEKKEINLNSGVLSDKTLNLIFKDIEKHLLKKNIKLI